MFDVIFPEFIESCARLYQALMPVSLAVLILSFAFEFWRGTDVQSLLRFLAKIFFILLLTAEAHQLINSGQIFVEQLVDKTGLVRPESLAEDYKAQLSKTLGDPSVKDASAWDLVMEGRFVDAILYACLLLVSYVSLGVVTFVTFVQKICLFVAWGSCPALFAFLAVPPLAHLGQAHCMRIFAIISWPIGFCVAATFSTGLLQMGLNDRLQFLNLATTVQGLLIIGVVGVWSIVSTILAPVFIQRLLVGQPGSARVNSALGALVYGSMMPVVISAISRALQSGRDHWQSFRESHGSSDMNQDVSASVPSFPPAPLPANSTSSNRFTDANDPTGSERLKDLLNDN